MKKVLMSCLIASLVSVSSYAQIGIFDQRADVGDLQLGPGQAAFDNGTYTMDALGTTIGRRSKSDEFNFVFKEMSGSFSIRADVFPNFADGEGGLMIRQSLDPDSQHASYLRVADNVPGGNTDAAFGTVFPHFRSLKGGGSVVDGDVGVGGFADNNIGPIRLDRIGNSIHFYTFNTNDEWQYIQTEIIPMEDPVLVGLAATANGAQALGEFEFMDVEIIEYPLHVSRNLPVDDIQPNSTLTEITVTAAVRSGQTVNAVVTEIPPGDGTASNVSASGGTAALNADGSITWTLNGHTGSATLTYNLALGPRQSASWQGTFDDGINRVSFIGGETVLPKNPVFMPADSAVDIDPDGITLIQAENFRLFNPDDADDFGLGVDPRTNSGIHVIDISGGSSQILEMPINITRAGTYFFFGRKRGEDGNSDSWHFEIDFPPAGDNSTRWDIGGGRTSTVSFVSSNTPALNPRPFELEAGGHFIMLANREDSASIDWIAVTMDSSIVVALFDDITGTVPEPIAFANVNVSNPVAKEMANGEGFCEAEDGYLVVTPADGAQAYTIFEERGTSGGRYINANLTTTAAVDFSNRVDYFFNITEPGTYRIIANTRTPSGSDDSFWVGMDNEQLVVAGIDDAFQGSTIQDNSFHSSWVETNNIPGQSWDLDVGVHVINVYNREDGTQMDWLLLTNNLDQDATIKTPPAGEPGTGVQEYMLY